MSPSDARPFVSVAARLLRWLPLVVALGYALLAGLKSTPEMRFLPGMPWSLGVWLDAHDFAKNVAGFALLTAAAHGAFPRHWGRNALAVGGLAVAIEGMQYFMPHRFADLRDVAAGLVGVALASGVWLLGRRIVEARRA